MENSPNQFQTPDYGVQQPLPNATAILVLGICSIVGCFCYGIVGAICGVIALVLANKDLKLYHADPASYSPGSFNNVKSGRVCAIIGLSLSALYLISVIIALVTIGTGILTDPTHFFQNRY